MNNVDSQYQNVLKNVISNGSFKETRSGKVISYLGCTMYFDLTQGFPVLTTKKMFTKGVIHELLWFLKGDTNIRYLLENGVHIWDDDAYRHYKNLVARHNELAGKKYNKEEIKSKEDFLKEVLAGKDIFLIVHKNSYGNSECIAYHYGDLGPVYGAQWRNWNNEGIDQVANVIKTLTSDPDDRRMIINGYNPSVLKKVALPPCHVLYQFYTREMTPMERKQEGMRLHGISSLQELDKMGFPTRYISVWFYCRSQDLFLGTPFNIMSASLLVSMIGQCVNMIPMEVLWNGGDCHIYENHLDAVHQLLQNNPDTYELPKLVLNKDITKLSDFKFEDIKIEGYQSFEKISAPLSVGE